MGTLLQDLRVAVRTLLKTPAFPLAAIGTLAIGIAATTAIFSTVNAALLTPLPYPDQSFDLVFAISVLTHIPSNLQQPWLTEIRRVLKPGGHALLSVHGASRIEALPEEARRRFEAGEHVVVGDEYAGTNLCGSYHPAAYVRDVLGKVMLLVAHLPDAARDSLQDFLLFRKA